MEKINVEERVQKARNLFLEGYNCSQSVFLAYCDLFDIETEFAAKISAPFGGGIGRLREVCGVVSGMSMIAGQIEPSFDPLDKDAKMRNYNLVRELAEKFREKNGTIICRELLGLDKDGNEIVPKPKKSKAESPCMEFVATAARIVGERLTILVKNYEKDA